MRRFVFIAACIATTACSSSSKNEAPAGGGAGGSTGGTAGASGGTGGSTGGTAGAGGSGGSAGGTGGSTGGTGGSTGGTGGGPTCKYDSTSNGFDCSPHKATSMAADASAIYWALRDVDGDEHLFRVLKTDQSTSVSPWAKIGKVPTVGDIVVDGNHAYVSTTSTSRQLIQYSIPAGTEKVIVNQSGCAQPYARAPLANDSSGVYFACNGSTDFIGIWKKAASTADILFNYPVSVTVDGLASNGSTLAVAIDDLDYIPLPSGSAGLIATGNGYTRVNFVGNVIYAQHVSGVKTHNVGGGAAGDAMTNVAGIVDFRVDASGIYAFSSDKIVGKKIGALSTLDVKTGILPGGIALDATQVYWTTTTGLVQRAARSTFEP